MTEKLEQSDNDFVLINLFGSNLSRKINVKAYSKSYDCVPKFFP